jgi:hypothetical protein
MADFIRDSLIKCPHCGFSKLEVMPIDSCCWFYECDHCRQLLTPRAGDCCVFCSYGSVECPPKQLGTSTCDGC